MRGAVRAGFSRIRRDVVFSSHKALPRSQQLGFPNKWRRLTMGMRHLTFCLILGGFILSDLPYDPQQPEAAQTAANKKKKEEKKVDQRKEWPHGLKEYPWGEPN